jgi:hypothetical protein
MVHCRAPGCVVFGLVSILLLTPLLGALPLTLLPIEPKALAMVSRLCYGYGTDSTILALSLRATICLAITCTASTAPIAWLCATSGSQTVLPGQH